MLRAIFENIDTSESVRAVFLPEEKTIVLWNNQNSWVGHPFPIWEIKEDLSASFAPSLYSPLTPVTPPERLIENSTSFRLSRL